MSLISCPINDGQRAPGRGGGGAVMGSKKLKAIVVRGTMEVAVAAPDKIMEISRKISNNIKEALLPRVLGPMAPVAWLRPQP